MFACLLCQRGDTTDSLGWALDILLKHLADGHNVKVDAEQAFKQEHVSLPGRTYEFEFCFRKSGIFIRFTPILIPILTYKA